MDLESIGMAMVQTLGWTLLDFVWQGALIGAVYALLRGVAVPATAPLRLRLGHLTLLAFALAPVITFQRRWAEVSAFGVADQNAGALPMDVLAATVTPGRDLEWLLPWAVALWGAGVLALAVRGLWHWRQLRRLCTRAQPLDAAWQARLRGLRERMGVRIEVILKESAQVAAPILVGWLRPVIVLPLGLCLRLPADQLELLLAHELAHVRRLDTWSNALQVALETVLFYHPLVHWVGRRIREDRELCCDALVATSIDTRLDYARALLALAEDHRKLRSGGLALAATGGALLARIEHLLELPRRRADSVPVALAVLVLGLALLLPRAEIDAVQGEPLQPLPPSQLSLARLAPIADLVVRDFGERVGALGLVAAPAAIETERADPVQGSVAPAPLPAAAAMDAAVPIPVPAEPAASLASPPAADDPVREPRLQTVPVLRPLDRPPPHYPRAALLRGQEGSVMLSFRVDARGRVVELRVESADSHLLAEAAREALARWRFPAGTDGARRHFQQIDFTLDQAAAENADEACLARTGSRICRRN